MKKILFFMVFMSSFLFSDMVEVDSFVTDVYSKDKNSLKKIEISLMFDGRDLEENMHKIIDTLNIIVSSFYIEDLFTSQGKENFKTTFIKYMEKKYNVEIEHIFIQKMMVKDGVTVDEFINALKKEGFYREKKEEKQIEIRELDVEPNKEES